ncbi:hypothetical protein RUM43_012363 [Polyplax serrata]|uniref:Uncharacterized protein n=1 Tax=Polyplax serrata TaxID=468196 RepID=A0AAN8P3Y8_POLSC
METDRRGGYDLQGEVESDDAGVVEGADAMSTTARELGDGISQIGVFTEEENHRNISTHPSQRVAVALPVEISSREHGGKKMGNHPTDPDGQWKIEMEQSIR